MKKCYGMMEFNGMKDGKEFKPYVPAEKAVSEFTITSVVTGVLLAVVFGAANAYLGLRVGMTVSASIPAAVVSMGVLRILLKRKSILESNMVQTIGSAGESLAAGAIFTMPAFFCGKRRGQRCAGNAFHLADCTNGRASWCPVHGAASECADCEGT